MQPVTCHVEAAARLLLLASLMLDACASLPAPTAAADCSCAK
jgi:hypothetical protein